MANKEKDKIEKAVPPRKPGRKLSPESRRKISEEARRRRELSSEQGSGIELSLEDLGAEVVEAGSQRALRRARREANEPAPDDIGEIVAAAMKRKSNTPSILDQPALNDINDILAAAKEVFGAEGGLRWLGTPVPALQYATPISLVETQAGRQKIHDALVNLAHGSW
jgi:hypothetical protein